MKILTVDIGTGTQDIFLYDSRLDLENGFKFVLPSPTMVIFQQIKEATHRGTPLLLSGVTMGGGPSAWATEAHVKAGYPLYATPQAARTLDDDLEKVEDMGIRVIGEDEASHLPETVVRLNMQDFDFTTIHETFARFGVSLSDLAAVAVAAFDHGAAPPGISDRQFRFNYLKQRIRDENRLSAFAYRAEDIPDMLTRLQAVAASARGVDAPLVVMDSAPAAILGATLDPIVARRERKMIINMGNFHTLAFRLGPGNIEGLFEHHTGLLDQPKMEHLLRALAKGSLQHRNIFNNGGHGALIYETTPLPLGEGEFDLVVTGPRRSIFGEGRQHPADMITTSPALRPYFAVPFGDMMISGCFGLLSAAADLLPELAETVRASLHGEGSHKVPWDI